MAKDMLHDIKVEDTDIVSFNFRIDKLRKEGYKLLDINDVDRNLNSDDIKFRCILRKKFESQVEYSVFIFFKGIQNYNSQSNLDF